MKNTKEKTYMAKLKNMFVCCVLTQNFKSWLVGKRKPFFLLPVLEEDISFKEKRY